jgi:DNA-binding NarL/FixJ family response regulator
MSAAAGKKPTVLIAEDQEILQQAIVELLRDEGFEVVGATMDGTVAIDLARDLKPDLALLDYRMPGADGISVTEQIRAESPGTKIVMLTAYEETSLSLEATWAGVSAFLLKGCNPARIVEALKTAYESEREA